MELEKTRNAKRNILYGMINRFIGILLPFLNRTVFLYVLGTEFLGLNSLFASILQVLNLAEMGIGSAVVYSMYRPIAEGNKSEVCALLYFYKRVYRWVGITIFFIGLMIIPFLPFFVHGDLPTGISLPLVYFVYLINTVISYFCFGYKTALPNAFQRTDIVSKVSSLTQMIQCILQIALLYTLADYYVYLLVMPMVTLLNNILVAKVVDAYYPGYHCGGVVSQRIRLDIRRKVYGLVIDKISGTTRNALDSICLSMYIGLSVTAIYNNYLYIVMAVTGIFGVIGASVMAGVGNSMVLYDREKNYQDMKRMNFIYMLLSGWAAIAILCLVQPFMEIWVGNELVFPTDIVLLLVGYFYLLRMGDVRFVYSDAAGLWWETRYRAVAESVANVVLNIVLGKIFGVRGIICATLLSLFFINFCWGSQIVFCHYFRNGKILEYYKDHLRYFGGTISVAVIVFGLCVLCQGEQLWQMFVYRLVVCTFVPSVMYFIVYHNTAIYQESIRWFLVRANLEDRFGFLLRK